MTTPRRRSRRRPPLVLLGLAVTLLTGCASGAGAVSFDGSGSTPDNPLSWSESKIYGDSAPGHSDSDLSACEGLGLDDSVIKLLQAPFLVPTTHEQAGLQCHYSDNVGMAEPAGLTTSAVLYVTTATASSTPAKYVYDMFALGAPQSSLAPPGYTEQPLHVGTDAALVTNGYNFWSEAKANGRQYGIEMHIGRGAHSKSYYVAALTAMLSQLATNRK